MKTNLTEKGKSLLLRALAGEELRFTKIMLGNGISEGAEEIINPLLTIEISNINVGAEYVTLTTLFNNSTVEGGFRVTEMGVYALDGEEEVIYSLANEDEGKADYIPSVDERMLEMQYDVIVFIGEAENISAAISGSVVYISKGDFEEHTKDTNNPHKVTKAQIGLGNVPNVATNDQTPTFEDTTAFEAPKSGEKMSTMFAKCAYAIKNLISHIGNKNNPHAVTAKQIGAAPTTHTHSAADLNAGVLSPERGGTGATSLGELSAKLSSLASVTGMYIGDGEKPRIIPLDFEPSAVLVIPMSEPVNVYGANSYTETYFGFAIKGYNYCQSESGLTEWSDKYSALGICEEGFKVSNTSFGTYEIVELNKSGKYYFYIAFR